MNESEIIAEREKMLAEARLTKSRMIRLLTDDGFRELMRVLQEQIDRRFLEVLQMPKSQADIIQRTYSTGEIAGIKLALDFPKVLIEYAQTSIDSDKIREEMKQDGQETRPNSVNSGAADANAGDEYDFDNDGRGPSGRSAP